MFLSPIHFDAYSETFNNQIPEKVAEKESRWGTKTETTLNGTLKIWWWGWKEFLPIVNQDLFNPHVEGREGKV